MRVYGALIGRFSFLSGRRIALIGWARALVESAWRPSEAPRQAQSVRGRMKGEPFLGNGPVFGMAQAWPVLQAF